MTAISAVGQAKFASVRICLDAITQYAPPYALRVMTVIFGTVASAKAKSNLAPCLMIPPNSCWVPGRKPGNIFEGDERDVEGVAEAHETRALHRGIDIENPGKKGRLIADDADGAAVERANPTTRFFA